MQGGQDEVFYGRGHREEDGKLRHLLYRRIKGPNRPKTLSEASRHLVNRFTDKPRMCSRLEKSHIK